MSESKPQAESIEALKRELKAQIQEEVEEEVEGEIKEEVSKHLSQRQVVGYFKSYFFAIAASIMALGQFSEAVTLIEDGLDWAMSKITNEVEYELLDQVHVGNTEPYIEDLLGAPQISRKIDEQITANYFYNDKFLLTIFFLDGRVEAYTVIPLVDGFEPVVAEGEDMEFKMGEFSYANYPGNPQAYMVDHSKVTSYYLEILETGRTGLFFKVYLGNIVVRSEDANPVIVDFYNMEVNESDDVIYAGQKKLRTEVKPNFYGMGMLTLEQIEKSILTGAEFSTYFGHSED